MTFLKLLIIGQKKRLRKIKNKMFYIINGSNCVTSLSLTSSLISTVSLIFCLTASSVATAAQSRLSLLNLCSISHTMHTHTHWEGSWRRRWRRVTWRVLDCSRGINFRHFICLLLHEEQPLVAGEQQTRYSSERLPPDASRWCLH